MREIYTVHKLTRLKSSEMAAGAPILDRLVPSATMPHTARKAKKAQNRIMRISSPADDLSNTKFISPLTPAVLLPGKFGGRKSLRYFLVREDTPSPHGQVNLLCSTAERLRGRPCSSHDTSKTPVASAGKGKGKGR
jgi:hypothetical protein